MPKNIVVCCDGTSNEFGAINSNVVKLYQALVCDAEQIGYYHPGVGTMGARSALTGIGKWWTKVIGLALGYLKMSKRIRSDSCWFMSRRVYRPKWNL